MDDKGELFTFTSSSRGRIGAIALLVRRYARHRKRHPEVFPLIKLSVDSYQHKIKELGRIKVPVFEPAGYVAKTDFLAALTGAGISVAAPGVVVTDDVSERRRRGRRTQRLHTILISTRRGAQSAPRHFLAGAIQCRKL
jgi:hypothetical protein